MKGIGFLIVAVILLAVVFERLKVWKIFYKNGNSQKNKKNTGLIL